MQTRKAQTLTPDFVVSFTIFLIIVATSINLWNVANEKNIWIYDLEDRQIKSRIIADTLINNPGEPKYWNNETVVLIGFSEEDHILNKTKLLLFKNLSYSKVKNLMNLGVNEFSLTITDKNDTVITIDPGILLEFGMSYENKANVVHSSRLVLINDSGNLTISKLNLILWSDK